MHCLSTATREYFFLFYFGEIPVPAFENWLYTDENLKAEISADDYLSLISLDYKNEEDIARARKLIGDIYDTGSSTSLVYDRTLSTLKGMTGGSLSLREGCKILADLRSEGYELIPAVFVGYSSEIDRLGDDGLDFYKDRIISDVQNLLHQIQQA